MLDVVVTDGIARGIVVRNLLNGEIEKYSAMQLCLLPAVMQMIFPFNQRYEQQCYGNMARS